MEDIEVTVTGRNSEYVEEEAIKKAQSWFTNKNGGAGEREILEVKRIWRVTPFIISNDGAVTMWEADVQVGLKEK